MNQKEMLLDVDVVFPIYSVLSRLQLSSEVSVLVVPFYFSME